MKKGLAVFSGSAVVHKLMQDGTVVLGTAANPAAVTVSGSVNVTGQMTAAANSVLVGNVGGEFTNTTLGGILVELKDQASAAEDLLQDNIDAEAVTRLAADDALDDRIDGVAADLATEQGRAGVAEAGLQLAINTEKDRIDAILSLSDADKNSFKEIVDLINSVDTTNDSAFAGYVISNNTAVADVEAGLQSQIDASAFKVNGLSVNAKSGSFTIVTGSSNNLTISNAGSAVTVDLNSSVTLAGTLSANVVSASAGLSVVGGASVAGGMTVSSGDVEVSHGTIKSVMDGTADATALTALASAAATSDGKFFYLKGSHASWARPDCWYFCQGGDWFDAPFYGEG